MFSARWQRLLRRILRPSWFHAAPRRAMQPQPADTQALDDDRPLGCGWFDSSHDLQHGLQVREADQQVLAQMPLADWLALQVTPCCEADTSLHAATGMIAA